MTLAYPVLTNPSGRIEEFIRLRKQNIFSKHVWMNFGSRCLSSEFLFWNTRVVIYCVSIKFGPLAYPREA